jgi:hypothetical protein
MNGREKSGTVITTRYRRAGDHHAQDVVYGQDVFNHPWGSKPFLNAITRVPRSKYFFDVKMSEMSCIFEKVFGSVESL